MLVKLTAKDDVRPHPNVYIRSPLGLYLIKIILGVFKVEYKIGTYALFNKSQTIGTGYRFKLDIVNESIKVEFGDCEVTNR